MRDYRRVGRSGRAAATPYHIAQHEAALARATAMFELRKQGMKDHEIGKLFGVSAAAVYFAIRRQGLK